MTEVLSQTTVEFPGSGAFADALAALRVSGQLLINEAYTAPWCVLVPGGAKLERLVDAPPGARLVPFHLVRRGAFELTRAGHAPRLVQAGEGVFLTSGGEHRLVEGRTARPTSLEALLKKHPRPIEEATSTALMCGVFVLHDVRFNPLFAALPEVLPVSFAGTSSSALQRGTAELLTAEATARGGPRPWVVSRLLELSCAEAILSAGTLLGKGSGWLHALQDGPVGTALSAFHHEPGAAWSVTRLARRASLSPSRFSARFRALLGVSPMAYVTSWRMALAERRLRDGEARVDEVGRSVGYDSLPAFSRAFKRQWGFSPKAARVTRLVRSTAN